MGCGRSSDSPDNPSLSSGRNRTWPDQDTWVEIRAPSSLIVIS